MKIAILNCLRANEVCGGCACLKAWNSKTRHFSRYENGNAELVAFARCNGCGKGVDAGFREKLERMVSEGAEVVHLGGCTVRMKDRTECPTITEAAEYLQAKGLTVVRGTH